MKSLSKNRLIATLITISFVGTSLLSPFSAYALTQEAIKKHQTIDDIFSDPKMQRDVAMIGVTCVVAAYLPTVIETVGNALSGAGAAIAGLMVIETGETIATKATTVLGPLGVAKQEVSDAAAVAAAAAAVTAAAASTVTAAPISSLPYTPMQAYLLSIVGSISGLHDTIQSSSIVTEATKAKNKGRDTITDCLVYSAGQLLLKQLTQDTVNWIKGGYHGSPSFAVDTHEIFLDLADSVAGDLAREVRGIAMCKFSANFQNDLANNIELSAKHIYKFNGATKCPFPETFNINSSDFYKGINTYAVPGIVAGAEAGVAGAKYAKNSNNFTWAGMEYAMQDAGNPFGVALLSGQELALRSSEKKDVQKQELSWSNGFTNMVDTANFNYPDKYAGSGDEIYYETVSNAEIADYAMAQRNLPRDQQVGIDTSGIVKLDPKDVRSLQKTYCPTTTPGKQIGDALTKATGIDMDRLGLIDSVNKIVGAIIEQATQSASMGIFNAISGQDAKVQQNYITTQDKTAETIAMEDYAIENAKDALATAQKNLAEASSGTSDETYYALKQAVDTAQKKVDAVTSVEFAINRQAELTAANAEVATALSAERNAQARADAASKAYYDALGGSLSGGTYIQPDPATLTELKLALDTANNALGVAQGETAKARQHLYDAQHP